MKMELVVYVLLGDGAEPILLSVDVDPSASVDDLKRAIKMAKDNDIPCAASRLNLYVAKTANGKWLKPTDVESVTLDQVRNGRFQRMLNEKPIGISLDLEHDALPWDEPDVRILAEDPTGDSNLRADRDGNARPPMQRLGYQRLPLCQPVQANEMCVPLDTISAFTTITATLASAAKPQLQLLYGPRQFGKTTITNAVYSWLETNDTPLARGSKTLLLYCDYDLINAKTTAAVWEALGRRFRETRPCADEASFLQIATTQGYDRFFLIVDELHQFFVHTEPAKQFIATLQRWQTQPFFAGFLGVGSEDLVLLYQDISGDHQLKSVQAVCVEPFSTEQMCGFYELVYTFGLSSYVKDQIRECSGGRPGIFVALIDYVRRQGKCNADRETWQQWLQNGGLELFAMHQDPDSACRSIRNDLRTLSDSEWTALEQIVEQQLTREEANEVDKPNETDRNRKMMVVTMEDSTRLDKLFRMQVVTRTNDGVAVASAVMLCLVQKEIRERKYGFEKAASEVDVEAWYFISERGLLGKKRHRDD